MFRQVRKMPSILFQWFRLWNLDFFLESRWRYCFLYPGAVDSNSILTWYSSPKEWYPAASMCKCSWSISPHQYETLTSWSRKNFLALSSFIIGSREWRLLDIKKYINAACWVRNQKIIYRHFWHSANANPIESRNGNNVPRNEDDSTAKEYLLR